MLRPAQGSPHCERSASVSKSARVSLGPEVQGKEVDILFSWSPRAGLKSGGGVGSGPRFQSRANTKTALPVPRDMVGEALIRCAASIWYSCVFAVPASGADDTNRTGSGSI